MSECAKCHVSVLVPDGHEFDDRDMCYTCLYAENDRKDVLIKGWREKFEFVKSANMDLNQALEGKNKLIKQLRKNDALILRLYGFIREITLYQSPDLLRRSSQKDWGLGYEEALEYAYENVIGTAKAAIKGVRLPKPEVDSAKSSTKTA